MEEEKEEEEEVEEEDEEERLSRDARTCELKRTVLCFIFSGLWPLFPSAEGASTARPSHTCSAGSA